MLWQRQRQPEVENDAQSVMAEALETLRTALAEIRTGVVLLDTELRATFINRAFRKMWRLTDEQADSQPAFVALMYHGRDTRAYAMPPHEVDGYIAERVALVRAGDPRPIDLWLANGEVLRFQCIVLSDGGRLLTYSYVTEMVRQADELRLLRSALDHVAPGVLLLDRHLNARFMNKAVRQLWNVDDSEVAAQPGFAQLMHGLRRRHAYAVPPDQLDRFMADRVAQVRAGDPTPRDFPLEDGRVIRAQCTVLPDGGRMLTYTDVSDLMGRIAELQRLAATDSATSLANRRHFRARLWAEWDRFQRYHRPLSLVVLDVDGFRELNERYGDEAGDRVLAQVAAACARDRRSSDLVARLDGDEFALLLPETDIDQAGALAERLRRTIEQGPMPVGGASIPVTVSVGVAGATVGMASADVLIGGAEHALTRAKGEGRNRTVRAEPPPGEYDHAAE